MLSRSGSLAASTIANRSSGLAFAPAFVASSIKTDGDDDAAVVVDQGVDVGCVVGLALRLQELLLDAELAAASCTPLQALALNERSSMPPASETMQARKSLLPVCRRRPVRTVVRCAATTR